MQNKIKLPRKSENAVNNDHILQFMFDKDTAVVKVERQQNTSA
jgi:hypothetical protein